jgi:triacylglycerol lipase
MTCFDLFDPRSLTFNIDNAMAMARCSEAAYPGSLTYDNVKRTETAEEWRLRVTDLLLSWRFDHIEFFDRNGSQAFLAGNKDQIVISFRGTEATALEDIAADLRVRQVGGPLAGRVHRGFLMALLAIWDDADTPNGRFIGIEHSLKSMKKAIDGSPALWITGHSLGAGLATIAAAFLLEEGRPVQGLHTFGCPRVGDSAFVTALDARSGKRNYRLVNNNDVVTRVPPRSFGYDHAGEFWYLSEKADLKCDPNSWYLFLDRSLGSLCDIGTAGVDAIKDHSMNSGIDGYIPALIKAQEKS